MAFAVVRGHERPLALELEGNPRPSYTAHARLLYQDQEDAA